MRNVRRCSPRRSGSISTASTTTSIGDHATIATEVFKASVTPSSSASETSATTATTSVSSLAKPSATEAPAATSGKLANLFPVGSSAKSWTTSPHSDSALPLSDATFRPNHILSALTHNYVTAPDGEKSMQATYPKGSHTFTHGILGGFSFYAPGPTSVDLSTAKEATFGYSVYFPEGFKFQLGGKLPGFYGGDSEAESIGCSGGRRSEKCFSARLMWRTDGAGELYTYLPPSDIPRFAANKAICKVKPVSDCNPTYGASVGRGSFSFAAGKRTYVSQRVRLNDVNQANGEIELFADGKSVVNVSGLILRDSGDGRIRGLQMQTFFGGSTEDFASPQTQSAYFSDMSVAITEHL